jgi:hypothetical protein
MKFHRAARPDQDFAKMTDRGKEEADLEKLWRDTKDPKWLKKNAKKRTDQEWGEFLMQPWNSHEEYVKELFLCGRRHPKSLQEKAKKYKKDKDGNPRTAMSILKTGLRWVHWEGLVASSFAIRHMGKGKAALLGVGTMRNEALHSE